MVCMVSEGKTKARPNFTGTFIQERVDRNGGRHDNFISTAQPNSALFSCQAQNRRNDKGVFCPIYYGRDAPFCVRV